MFGHGHRTSGGHHLHACIVEHGGELTGKGHFSVFVIFGVRSIDIFACHQGKAEVELVGACSFIVGSYHIVWRRSKVATFVFRACFVGVVHTANTAFDVEIARVSARFVVAFVEVVADVVHEDTTEVAVSSVASHVSGRTRPDGLLVELDLVHLHSAEKASAEVSIAQGEGVFHPRIVHTHGWFRVPKCEGTFGTEGVVAGKSVFAFGKLVAICRISGRGHVVGKGEVKGIVGVGVVPEANLFAHSRSAERIERIVLVVHACNHVVSFAKCRAIEQGEVQGLCSFLHAGQTIADETYVVAILATEHKALTCADEGKELCRSIVAVVGRNFSINTFVHEFHSAILEANVVVGSSIELILCREVGHWTLCHGGSTGGS